MSVLNDPILERLLSDLHAKSAAQLADIERYVRDARRGNSPTKEADFKQFRSDKLLALNRDKGEFCYQICRAIGARTIVEIGTSHGVSTLYLAAAVRDNGGGVVIGTEYEAPKVTAARSHFEHVGLSRFIDLLEGDFRDTLQQIDGSVDFMLIDAWKGSAIPALELVGPWLRDRAVIVCDDILLNCSDDYFTALSAAGFSTTILPFQDGLGLSVRK